MSYSLHWSGYKVVPPFNKQCVKKNTEKRRTECLNTTFPLITIPYMSYREEKKCHSKREYYKTYLQYIIFTKLYLELKASKFPFISII